MKTLTFDEIVELLIQNQKKMEITLDQEKSYVYYLKGLRQEEKSIHTVLKEELATIKKENETMSGEEMDHYGVIIDLQKLLFENNLMSTEMMATLEENNLLISLSDRESISGRYYEDLDDRRQQMSDDIEGEYALKYLDQPDVISDLTSTNESNVIVIKSLGNVISEYVKESEIDKERIKDLSASYSRVWVQRNNYEREICTLRQEILDMKEGVDMNVPHVK